MAKVFLHEQSSNVSGNKESSARLTVNCPEGSIVTVSKGNTVYTATATEGSASFNNLTHGAWTVTITKDGQTATKTVDIVTDYEIQISFFTSYINVTYPSGAICTISFENKTYTAPDTTGYWSCIVPSIGTYIVSCTDGNETKSKEVSVTENEQTISVELTFFTATIDVTYPPGAICSCSNEALIYSASDTTGSWRFVVHKTGTWTVKATDGIQTLTENVEITEDGQAETVTIRFFASTIAITYPTGSKCTVTDGITTFTAPDTSGVWLATVPRTGIWTIKAVNGSKTVIETVEISEDGQAESIILKFFASYINVTYPSGTFKLVLWYVDEYGNRQEIAVDTSGSGNCRFIVSQVGTYEVGAYRVIPYVGIETTPGDYVGETTTISEDNQTVNITLTYNTVPEFTYTGTYKIVNDAGENITNSIDNWNIMFLTSGILRFTELNGAKKGIDVFACGGGGNGGETLLMNLGGVNYSGGGGGGGGGYRESVFGVGVSENSPYQITIGGASGTSSGFGASASGGSNGGKASDLGDVSQAGPGGEGGSVGGRGAVNSIPALNGSDGSYAFLDSYGKLYGPGGGGGQGINFYGGANVGAAGQGGKDGGGNGGKNADSNSGGGGGGANYETYGAGPAGSGGSGIVIIRNKR